MTASLNFELRISLQNLEKRYNVERIFKNLDYEFTSGHAYALTGANGSGKSTLLQIIAGCQLPSGGEIRYTKNGDAIPTDEIYQQLTIASPSMALIEDFTLKECLTFHFKFKQPQNNRTIPEIIERAYLQDAEHKLIKNFSSGMKQRLKLALAFYTESKLILLDEPTTALDAKNTAWYHEHMKILVSKPEQLVIIASNQPGEYEPYCQHLLKMEDYKA